MHKYFHKIILRIADGGYMGLLWMRMATTVRHQFIQ